MTITVPSVKVFSTLFSFSIMQKENWFLSFAKDPGFPAEKVLIWEVSEE